MNPDDQYLVDVIGFNDVERAMLSSIFSLAARRDPGFAQFKPGTPDRTPDIYLVDAGDPKAFDEFRALQRRAKLPAVLVGSQTNPDLGVTLPRPLQWAKLLQALDDTLANGSDGASAGTAAAPMDPSASQALVMRRTLSGTPSLGRSHPARDVADAAAQKRILGDAVLVVDDNATVRMFMQAKLAPYGFEVDIAESGEEAVKMSGSQEYACVFLDVVLPGIDGYQVCKLIKSNKQAIKKTAVVMLTSRSSPFDKLRGSLAGCDEYLTKPLDEDRLLEVIAKFLPNSRKHKERSRRK
jgi:two-component system, cell cycle response regulator